MTIGAVAGALAAAVPGAHPNTLAAIAVARGLAGAGALVALGAAYACSAPAVGAFLGASEESALSAGPAQRFLTAGRAREAAELAADGAILGVLFALPACALLLVVLRASAEAIVAAAPLAVALLSVSLVAFAKRRWAAAAFLVLSGVLGLLALRLGVRSPLHFPASALLPLLAGLFGAPGLLALVGARDFPLQKAVPATEPARRLLRTAASGAAAGSLVGLFPALTSGVAAGPLLARTRREEAPVILLAAASGAGAVFTLAALFVLGRARSGALAAARAVEPLPAWTGGPPPAEAAAWAAALLVGAAAGYGFARASAVLLPSILNAIGARLVGMAGLVLLTAATAACTGVVGLVIAGTACALGVACGRAGAPRTALLGCLLLPALVALTGSAL